MTHCTRLILALLVVSSWALEGHWFPADPEGPLPTSKEYRDRLRSLCNVMSSGNRLPKELEDKKPELQRLCQRLAEADKGAEPEEAINYGFWVCVLAALVVGYYLYTSRASNQGRRLGTR